MKPFHCKIKMPAEYESSQGGAALADGLADGLDRNMSYMS